ncbi:MAG: phosphotransferase [Kangiellaceae bacterium]
MPPNWWHHSQSVWQEIFDYFCHSGNQEKEIRNGTNWTQISIGRSNFSYRFVGNKTYFIQIINHSNNQFLPYERDVDLKKSISAQSYSQISPWLVTTLYQSKWGKIQSWFESKPLRLHLKNDLKIIKTLAEFLAKLHSSEIKDLPQFNLEEHLKKYQKIAISKTDDNEIHDQINKNLKTSLSLINNYESFAPCHYDLNLNNILINEQNTRIKFIDWEYLCVGDPMLDISAIISNSKFSIAQSSKFIAYYRQFLDAKIIRKIDTSEEKLADMVSLNNCIYKLWEYGQPLN